MCDRADERTASGCYIYIYVGGSGLYFVDSYGMILEVSTIHGILTMKVTFN